MEARCDFRDAPRAVGDDDEIHDHQNREDDNSDHEIAAHHEIAERFDDMAGGGGALVAARQDQPRRSQVSDSRSMVEIRRMVGNEENSSGAWMNSAVIRIRFASVIAIA